MFVNRLLKELVSLVYFFFCSYKETYNLFPPPISDVENVTLLDNVMPSVTEMTIMFWMKVNENKSMTLLSYAVEDNPDKFVLSFERQ